MRVVAELLRERLADTDHVEALIARAPCFRRRVLAVLLHLIGLPGVRVIDEHRGRPLLRRL